MAFVGPNGESLIVARDDGIVRTHDEAAALLDSAAPGALVYLDRRPKPTVRERAYEASRQYSVVLPEARHVTPSTCDVYTLPCRADALARRVRELADAARAECRRVMPHLTGEYEWTTT